MSNAQTGITAANDLTNAAAQRIEDFNGRLSEASKAAGLASLDAYDKVVQTSLSVAERVADSTGGVPVVGDVVKAQTAVAGALARGYGDAARKLFA